MTVLIRQWVLCQRHKEQSSAKRSFPIQCLLSGGLAKLGESFTFNNHCKKLNGMHCSQYDVDCDPCLTAYSSTVKRIHVLVACLLSFSLSRRPDYKVPASPTEDLSDIPYSTI